MNDDELDTRLTEHLRATAAAAPEPAPFPAERLRRGGGAARPGWRRPLLSAAAVVLAVVVGAGAWWLATGPGSGEQVDTGPEELPAEELLRVHYERLDVELTWELDCAELDGGLGPLPVTLEVETWWSPEQQLLRQSWRYPDSTSRDTVTEGDPWAPTAEHRVERAGGTPAIGCTDVPVTVREPGNGNLFVLGVVPTPATIDEAVAYGATDEPGEHRDRVGRVAQLRRTTGEGVVGDGGRRIRVADTMEWLAEPGTERLLERRVESVFEGIGVVRWSAVLVDDTDRDVPVDLFEVGGERLAPQDARSEASTTVVQGVEPGG